MLTYADFYDIAVYGNENWKGNFTKKQIACNAYDYYSDFEWSKANDEIAHNIKLLCKNLADDLREMPDLEEPREWLYRIAEELDLLDIDYMDYEETDKAIIEYFKGINGYK